MRIMTIVREDGNFCDLMLGLLDERNVHNGDMRKKEGVS